MKRSVQRLCLLVLLVVSVWSSAVYAVFATAQFTLTQQDAAISIDLASTREISAFSFNLAYDAQVISPTLCSATVGACNIAFERDSAGLDSLRVNFVSLTPITDVADFLNVTFSCLQDGSSAVSLYVERLIDIDAQPIDFGVETVVYECGVPTSVNLQSTQSITPNARQAVAVLILITMLLIVTVRHRALVLVFCAVLFNYGIIGTAVAGSSPTLGDNNCDGVVDVIDALYALQFSAELRDGGNDCGLAGSQVDLAGCDVSLNLVCDSADSTLIKACDLGYTNEFCVPDRLLDRYIFSFDGATAQSHIEALTQSIVGQGGTVLHTFEANRGFAAALLPSQLAPMLDDTLLTDVVLDQLVTVDAERSGQPVADLWGLDRINQRDLPLDQHYETAATGAGVNVYIIDSGIYPSTDHFGNRVVQGVSFVEGEESTTDCHGHGTHVAGTVGGATTGVAPGATLIPVRVLDCSGRGALSDVIRGFDWVAHNFQAPAVANASLGQARQPLLDEVAEKMVAAGISLVAAAGNSTTQACRHSPARAESVITVGASDVEDNQTDFSNYGSCIDLFAPGENIASVSHQPGGDLLSMDGTSMAAPHVTGAIALHLEGNPNVLPEDISPALLDTATDGRLNVSGGGTPNKLLYTASDSSAPTLFNHDAESRLYIDQDGERINLEICDDNIIGQTLYVQLKSDSNTWDTVSFQPQARCHTFFNLDGDSALSQETYMTRAALNLSPNPDWPVPCAIEGEGQGICNTAVYMQGNCPTDERYGVYIYVDTDFSGTCFFTTVSIDFLGDTILGDNNVSSIIIRGYYQARLYEYPNQGGRFHEVNGNGYGQEANLDIVPLRHQFSSVDIALQNDALWVTDIQSASGSEYLWRKCKVGEPYYVDRDHTITGVSNDNYSNLWCIRTSNEDKDNADQELLTFRLNKRARIYIYFDRRVTTPPAWVAGLYQQNGKQIYVSDVDQGHFVIYSCDSDVGEITLGGPRFNGGDGGSSMYVVAFIPDEGGGPLCTTTSSSRRIQ